MNIEEIKKNAPQGATHYTELNYIGGVEYFRVYKSGTIFVWDGMWHKLVECQYEYIKQRIKPLN